MFSKIIVPTRYVSPSDFVIMSDVQVRHTLSDGITRPGYVIADYIIADDKSEL